MNILTFLASRSKTATHLCILVGLAVLVILLPAGMWDLRGPDEGRYTQIAKELLTRSNWFALTVMDRPYDQKPPLAFWLLALMLKTTGGEPVSWALRMPSILAGIGTLVLTYFMGKKFAGPSAGFLSGLFLLTSLAFLDDAPTVELNMLYSFFTVASLSVWLLNYEKQRLSLLQCAGFWLLLTAAFLVKGPLAILVILSALGYTAWRRKSWQPFKAVGIAWGFPLMLAIIGLWFLAQSMAYGSEFVQKQISGETVNRSIHGDHGRSPFYYFPRLFTALMGPWAFFFIAALVLLWRNRGRNEAYTVPLLGWIIIPAIVLIIANGKRVPYMLPLLPAMCLVAGIYTDRHLVSQVTPTPWRRVITGAVVLIALIVVGAGITFVFPSRIYNVPEWHDIINFRRLNPVIWIPMGFVVGVIAYLFHASKRTWGEACWAIALTVLIVHLLNFTTIRPATDPGKSARHFSEHVEMVLQSSGETRLATLPDLAEPEFHAYSHYHVVFAPKNQMDLYSTTMPAVLALKGDEIQTSGPAAIEAGYREIFDDLVTKRHVKIYLREEHPTSN